MSIKVMAWAWEQELPSTPKFVLLALADHANDNGTCWPGQQGLAEKTGFGRQTVNRAIAILVEKGVIEVIRRFDSEQRPRSNQYQICLKQGGNVADDDTKCRPERQGYVVESDIEPSVRTINETSDHVDDSISVQELLESWNEICPPLGLSAVRELSATRRGKVTSRLREHPKVQFWNDVFRAIKGSAFLLGAGPPNGKAPWKVTFDWLIENDTNCLKVAEGRYAKG